MKYITILLLLFSQSLFAVDFYSGSKTGTYYRFGKDIKAQCSNLNLKVQTSSGSLNNIQSLTANKDAFGIVQQDIYDYIVDKFGPKAKGIKLVYPLYLEEIHLIVSRESDIQDIDDFKGKKINVGKRESGTWLTAQNFKKALDGKVFQETNYSTKDALLKTLTGEISGMIAVVGSPWEVLDNLPDYTSSFLNIISVESHELDHEYQKSTLDYFGLNAKTYGVYSLIVTSSDNEAMVSKMIKCIDKNINVFKKVGHPKWNTVAKGNFVKIEWPRHPVLDASLDLKKKKKDLIQKVKEL